MSNCLEVDKRDKKYPETKNDEKRCPQDKLNIGREFEFEFFGVRFLRSEKNIPKQKR